MDLDGIVQAKGFALQVIEKLSRYWIKVKNLKYSRTKVGLMTSLIK